MQESVWRLFPRDRQGFWEQTVRASERIQEIRLRINRPVLLRCREGDFYLDEKGRMISEPDMAHRVTEQELEQLLMHLCHDSPYAFEDELRQGFLTVQGGHRIGVAGQAVLESDGRLRTLKHIYYMNIRIAHQVFGVAENLLPHIYEQGQLKNVLIISPPGCGKTTLLRELVRRISDGNSYGKGLSVGVVDERSEIAGSYLGRPQNDLGCRTDVLDACPKVLGMMLLLRSMAPQVIAVDELGSGEDVAALRMACASGSRIVATIHGTDSDDVAYKFPELADSRIFDCLVVLENRNGIPGIKQIILKEDGDFAFGGSNHDSGRMHGVRALVSGTVDGKAPGTSDIDNDVGNVYQ